MPSSYTRRFGADAVYSEKISKLQTRFIIELVLGILSFFAAILFAEMEKDIRNLEFRDIYNVLKYLFIGIGLLEVIMSPIQLWANSKTVNKLNNTFITVEEDKVSGIQYNNPDAGAFFELPYSELTQAIALPEDATMNTIELQTKTFRYKCFAIADKAIAVKLINDKKAEFDARASAVHYAQPQYDTIGYTQPLYNNAGVYARHDSNPVPTETLVQTAVQNASADNFRSETAQSGTKYCMYCAAELPSEAAFCFKCGKKQ